MDKPVNLFRHGKSLIVLIPRGLNDHERAAVLLRLQLNLPALFVLADDGVRRIHDGRGRAVIPPQGNHLRLRKIPLKLRDVPNVRVTP